MIKQHVKNEFYIKPLYGKWRGKYFAVIDGYDKSMASLESTYNDADKLAKDLNETRNRVYNL